MPKRLLDALQNKKKNLHSKGRVLKMSVDVVAPSMSNSIHLMELLTVVSTTPIGP